MSVEASDWLTKQEVADYLQVSLRQVGRLKLPRTFVGSSPRYSRRAIDEWLARHTVTPRADKRRAGAAHRLPPQPPVNLDDWAKKLERDLGGGSRKRIKAGH